MRIVFPIVLTLLFALSGYTLHFDTKRQSEIRAQPFSSPNSVKSVEYKKGYSPQQIWRAYDIDRQSGGGKGSTIAIVVAYGNPHIENDVAVFSEQFDLPKLALSIAYPSGKPDSTNPRILDAWMSETSLDVEWAHAIAPEAPLLLVVAKSDSLDHMAEAIRYTSKQDVQVVSMSWGVPEGAYVHELSDHLKRAQTVYVASTGDTGGGSVFWPASSPDVIAVGGTTLHLDERGNLLGFETAWDASSGGHSVYYEAPPYQTDDGISLERMRGVPDVSFLASRTPGVAVYASDSRGTSGWFTDGGTSLGAPAWAGIVALANEHRAVPISGGHRDLYTLNDRNVFRDITEGKNGLCRECNAGKGFDLVTGLGSPHVSNLVQALLPVNVPVYIALGGRR